MMIMMKSPIHAWMGRLIVQLRFELEMGPVLAFARLKLLKWLTQRWLLCSGR
jgi:hypothetical protein